MSRFLLASMPVPGHILPMTLIAEELILHNHEVVWYSSKFFKDKIEATGARFAPILSALDYGDNRYNDYFPERATLKGLQQIKFDFKHLFLDGVEGHLKDLRAILKDYPADALLHDPAMVAGKILGETGVIPNAVLNITVLGIPGRDVAPFGLGLPPMPGALGRLRNRVMRAVANNLVFRDVNQHGAAILDRLRFPRFPFGPLDSKFLFLHPGTPQFEYPRSDLPPSVHFIGPLLPHFNGDFVAPAWWSDVTNAHKSVVLVTQGTIATDTSELIQPVLQALANEDVLVVAATGGQDLNAPVPANARVTKFIPFNVLMPHVKAYITNGGYGGVTIALAHGVPCVCAGSTEDKPEVGNRVAYSGVGINLKTARPTPDQIRSAVGQIMREARYRDNAKRIQAEFAKHDAPNEAARLLAQLAITHKPVLRTSQDTWTNADAMTLATA